VALAKNSSFVFFSVGSCVGKKTNVLFVRLAFLVQMFNYSTISALCTTVWLYAVARKKAIRYSFSYKFSK
jgi:hypothetical protein